MCLQQSLRIPTVAPRADACFGVAVTCLMERGTHATRRGVRGDFVPE